MTDEQRWVIQGRTRDRLQRALADLATLRADLSEFAARLREAADGLAFFLSEPTGAGPTGVAKDEYVIRYWSELLTREIAEKVRECARVAARVKELEEQVKQF